LINRDLINMSKTIDNKPGEFVSLVGLGAWKMFPWAERSIANGDGSDPSKILDGFSASPTPGEALAQVTRNPAGPAENRPPQGSAIFKDKA